MTHGNPICKLFLENNMSYLNIGHSKKNFNVGSSFCYYVVDKINEYTETKVDCLYNKKSYSSSIKLDKNIPCLPILLEKQFYALFKKMYNHNNHFDVKFDYKFDPRKSYVHNKTEKFKYPLLHTETKRWRYSTSKSR